MHGACFSAHLALKFGAGLPLHLALMSESIAPKLSKWPFFLGDALLLGTACFIAYQSKFMLGHWELCFVVLCVAGGALLGVAPFLLEYHALVKVAEAGALNTVVSQLKNLEGIANQISGATGKWQDAQGQADKTAAAAREIAERMTGEVQAFTEFMKRANDSERAKLRLEAEKLRRGESEWLQVRCGCSIMYTRCTRARAGRASRIWSSRWAVSRTPAAMRRAASG